MIENENLVVFLQYFFFININNNGNLLLVVQNETSKALDRPSDLLSLEDTLRNPTWVSLVTLIFIVLEMICAFIAFNYLNKLIDQTNDNS